MTTATFVLAEGSGTLSDMLMGAGVFLLVAILMMNLRRKQANRKKTHVDPREQVEQTRQTNTMRNDMRQMMVELEDLTRRFGAQLDAKSTALERVIEEADAKIAELKRLQGEETAPITKAAEPKEVPAMLEPEEIDPVTDKIYRFSDQGMNSVDIACELGEHVGKVELILALRQQSA